MFDEKQRESLKTTIEGVQRDKRAAIALADAELRKKQDDTAATMHVGIFDGQVSRRQIDAAVSSGQVSNLDKPRLVSALETYQNKQIAETAMSAAQKALVTAQSEVAKSEILAMPPDLLLGKWAKEDEDRFASLTVAHQADVLQKVEAMRQTGQTSNAITAIKSDMLAQAQLSMPKGWTLSGANQDANQRKFQGILYTLAENESKATGGQPITAARVRELTAAAYHEYNAKKYPAATGPGQLADITRAVDPQKYADVKRALQRATGAVPSDDDIMRAYYAVLGQEQGGKK
jgi:hypothetical protein